MYSRYAQCPEQSGSGHPLSLRILTWRGEIPLFPLFLFSPMVVSRETTWLIDLSILGEGDLI